MYDSHIPLPVSMKYILSLESLLSGLEYREISLCDTRMCYEKTLNLDMSPLLTNKLSKTGQ